MKNVQIAYYILVVFFLVITICAGSCTYQVLFGDILSVAIGLMGLIVIVPSLIVVGTLVYLTSDHAHCVEVSY